MILSMPMIWQIAIIIGLVLLFVGTYFLDHKMNSQKNEDEDKNDNCKSCGSNNCFLKTENFEKIKKEIAKEKEKDEK